MRNKPCISVLTIWLSLVFLSLSLSSAQAAESPSGWYVGSSAYSNQKLYSTYTAAGEYILNRERAERPEYNLVIQKYVVTVATQPQTLYVAICKAAGGGCNSFYIKQLGQCLAPKVFNSSSGACTDPCSNTIGNEEPHKHKIGDILPTGLSPGPVTPDSICAYSCRYVSPVPLGDAYRFINANPAEAFQNYSYRGDGTSCVGSETPQEVPNPSKKPSSSASNECTDKVEDAEGRVHFTCQASAEYRNPGAMNCGTVDGKTVCVPKSPAPKYEKKQSTADTTEKTNADGSKSTTTTTTTNTTSCVGANACTSTTTTTTESKGTNPDGSPGGSSSTCTGDRCGPDGSEQPPEDPTDKPDEEEQCDPATDPNRCGESSVTGEACDASVNCSGDAVQCAILRKQKEQTCADEKFREVTPEKVNALRTELNSEFAGPDFQPLQADASNSFDFSAVIDTSSRFGSSCPVVPDLSLPWLEGATVKVEFSTMIELLCSYLGWMGYLLVAFAMRGAAEIIANGMK